MKVQKNIQEAMKDHLKGYQVDKKIQKQRERESGENLMAPIPMMKNMMVKNLKKIEQLNLSQPFLSTAFKKDSCKHVCEAIARWLYHAVIPFNVEDSIFFTKACERVTRYGPTFRPYKTQAFHQMVLVLVWP